MSTTSLSLTHEERVELFLVLLEGNNGDIGKTCREMGMSRQTYYNWQEAEGEHYDILRERIRRIRRGWVDGLLDLAESKLEENVNRGIGQDVRYVLSKLGKVRGYGDSIQVDVHPVGIPGLVYPSEPATLAEFEELTAGEGKHSTDN